jgi:uncharacterized membrane protein YhhN
MSPSARNLCIYFFIAIAVFFLASRLVTVELVLAHASEDAGPMFFLKQAIFSVICVGLIVWLWRKRIRRPVDVNSEG